MTDAEKDLILNIKSSELKGFINDFNENLKKMGIPKVFKLKDIYTEKGGALEPSHPRFKIQPELFNMNAMIYDILDNHCSL